MVANVNVVITELKVPLNLTTKNMKVSTPCINVCKLKDGVCTGCKRTKQQIGEWLKYTEEQRQQIIKEIQDGRSGQ